MGKASWTILNNNAALSLGSDKILAWLFSQGISEEIALSIQLTLEEMITNTIKYGFSDFAEHPIEVEIQIEEKAIILNLTDQGNPFHPFEHPESDTTLSAEERPIGGLGLSLVKRIMNSSSYTREGSSNRVQFRKDL